MLPAAFRSRPVLLLLACAVSVVFVLWQWGYLQNQSSHGRTYEGPCTLDAMNNIPLDQGDPCVVQLLREKFLHSPSKGPVNLEHPETENPSMGQAQSVLVQLNNKKGGFFIECGALDGETRSNTLYMEQQLGWNGVLIEGDPDNFAKLKKKNRRAWGVSACLSTLPHPKIVMFKQGFNVGRISQGDDRAGTEVQVQCFPLYSILLALNQTEVDYFSLDIEGDELAVLKTIPWDRVTIHTLSVEFIHDKEGKEEIRNFMAGKGYEVITEVTHPMWLANDFIFAKAS